MVRSHCKAEGEFLCKAVPHCWCTKIFVCKPALRFSAYLEALEFYSFLWKSLWKYLFLQLCCSSLRYWYLAFGNAVGRVMALPLCLRWCSEGARLLSVVPGQDKRQWPPAGYRAQAAHTHWMDFPWLAIYRYSLQSIRSFLIWQPVAFLAVRRLKSRKWAVNMSL